MDMVDLRGENDFFLAAMGGLQWQYHIYMENGGHPGDDTLLWDDLVSDNLLDSILLAFLPLHTPFTRRFSVFFGTPGAKELCNQFSVSLST